MIIIEFQLELIDLSVEENRDRLSFSVSKFFTLNELEDLCEKIVSIDFLQKRDIDVSVFNIFNIELNSKFINVSDVLDVNHFPFRRWIEVFIDDRNSFIKATYYFKYSVYMYEYLNYVVTTAYNIKMYDNSYSENDKVSKLNIAHNYASKIYRFIRCSENANSIYNNMSIIVHSLFNNKYLLKSNKYFKIFDVQDNYQVEISSFSDNIFKFQINNKKDRVYIYVNKSIIGLSTLIYIIEKSYNLYKKESL